MAFCSMGSYHQAWPMPEQGYAFHRTVRAGHSMAGRHIGRMTDLCIYFRIVNLVLLDGLLDLHMCTRSPRVHASSSGSMVIHLMQQQSHSTGVTFSAYLQLFSLLILLRLFGSPDELLGGEPAALLGCQGALVQIHPTPRHQTWAVQPCVARMHRGSQLAQLGRMSALRRHLNA